MTDAKREQIKHCPFCGATNVGVGLDDYGNEAVWCGFCGVMGPPGKTAELAIRYWNTRQGSGVRND